MKNFSNNLFTDTENKVKKLLQENPQEDHLFSHEIIKIWRNGLEELKVFLYKHPFESKKEEIDFFKNIKPKFMSELIYRNERSIMERKKPSSTSKALHKFYKKELKKVKYFFIANYELQKYLRNNYEHWDEIYFLRNGKTDKEELDSYYFITDTNFSTSHDYKVAWIKAYEKLEQDLLETLKLTPKKNQVNNIIQPSLVWTGTKVGIVELIYALHTTGVFNHGSSSLKEIVQVFSQAFSIELMQFHRVFNEITARKSERTKFLNTLAQHLINKIEQTDVK